MLYPGSVFRGPTAWILHTLIPVAFVAYIPARIFQSFDARLLALVIAADAVIVLVSVLLFRRGLRKYESGNLIGTRV